MNNLTVQEKLDLLLKQSEDMQKEISELKSEVAKEEIINKSIHTSDPLKLEGEMDIVLLQSNPPSWEKAKSRKSEYPLYIAIKGNNGGHIGGSGVSLNDMVSMRNYLTKKINFMRRDENEIDDMF